MRIISGFSTNNSHNWGNDRTPVYYKGTLNHSMSSTSQRGRNFCKVGEQTHGRKGQLSNECSWRGTVAQEKA